MSTQYVLPVQVLWMMSIHFLSVDPGFSQTDSAATIVYLNKIPQEGIALDKGWKLSPDDDPSFAQPGISDANWQTININQPAPEFLKKTQGKASWLRFHFQTDSALANNLLSLKLFQFGSSEVFLDGIRLDNVGKTSLAELIPLKPFFQSRSTEHILAIRFVCPFPSPSWLLKIATIQPISVKLQPATSSIRDLQTERRRSIMTIGIASINAVFGLLFLLIYIFYRHQPLNLFFSLYNFSLIPITENFWRLFTQGSHSLNGFAYYALGKDFSGRLAGSTILVFTSLALFKRVHPLYKVLIAYILSVSFIFVNFFPGPLVFFIEFLTHIAFTFSFLWLAIRAFGRSVLKDWFIGIMAFLSFLVNLGFFLFNLWGIEASYLFELVFPMVTLPSMIIYLALNYAHTNSSLENQLVQVKTLSEENLRKEQEKQQILATQNETLEKQVEERTSELRKTIVDLKSTQSLLIQSEKMASLGELTAGIAHEIQNPLNFVNNFSDVNRELIDEARQALNSRNLEGLSEILEILKENEVKIKNHGGRADSIVKSMLQHTRSSSGQKEPSDLNALAEEYLKLAYHGIRAKDKNFHVNLETNFDPKAGLANIIPQEIGRVMLNIYNNAFYAVDEKKKTNGAGYEPVVSVGTERLQDKIIFKVRDNGIGIADPLKKKIFQPFFTTKPTGKGTGLGLSLSYDIIKAHQGEINVDSIERSYTEVTVKLPA